MDVRVVQGERWGLALYVTESVDGVETAVPLTTPTMMEIRTGESRAAPIVVRCDSEAGDGEGSITSDGLPRGGLIIDLDTSDLPPGFGYWDFWARRADDPGTPRRYLSGTFTIDPRVTGEITVDVVVDDADE